MKEFVNNGLVDDRKPPKKRAREIAEIWGEEYEPLINVLELCIKNGIGTLACCAGHEEKAWPHPYILFKADNSLAYNILERMKDDNTIKYISIVRHKEFHVPVYALYGIYELREEFFNKINAYIQEYTKDNKRNTKITGINKLNKIYKRNYANESLLKKILFLCNSKYFNKMIKYTPKTKTYSFLGDSKDDDMNQEYTEKEIEQMYPKGFLMDEEERKNISVIEEIKKKCLNSKVGLNRLGELHRKFQKNEKEMQMDKEYVSVEKVDENPIDEIEFVDRWKNIKELRELYSKDEEEK